jgi:hypothetical protein
MEEVIKILEVLANPNPEHLKEAEARLNEAKKVQGFSVLMLQIVLGDNISPPARALAAIILKQTIETQWVPLSQEIQAIPPQDKSMIRENAVQALLHCHPQVAAQLREAIKTIIRHDWPERWPELIPRVLDILKTQQNPRMLEGALLCYCAVVKKGEWEQDRERLYALVQETFPFIYDFLCHTRTINTAESYVLQKIICKTFYASFQLKMPPYLKADEVLGPWLAKFMEILMAPLPDGQPELQNPAEWAPWKAKKWCMHIFNRLFIRFGDPMLSKKKEKRQWANNFAKNYATKILQGVLQIVDLKRNGMMIPDPLMSVLLRFVSTSVIHTSTWPILYPYCSTMIVEVLFPIVSFNDEDERTWKEDPAEYIRKEYDILEEYLSVKSAAVDLISSLVRLRADDTLRFLLDMIVDVFNQYKTVPDHLKNPRRVEGVLNIFGSISEEYMSNERFSDSLDSLIAEHVLPHMDSQNPYLVARACWCFGRYALYMGTSDLIVEGIKRVLNILKHPELPTRVQAALALRSLVQTDEAKPLLGNVLPDLFQIMFSLINEIDSDDLVSALDSIIFEFKNSIGPYAVAICEQLTKELFRLSANVDEDDSETAILAAAECGRALVTVLSGVRRTPDLYPEIFRVVLPFLKNAIQTAQDDFVEHALQVLSFVSYFIPKPFPPELWEFFHMVLVPVDTFPFTYIEEIVPFLDNMITRDPQGFLGGVTPGGTRYLDLMGNLLVHILDREDEEIPGSEALKLLEVMFQNCGGAIDGLVPVTLGLVLKRLMNSDSSKFRVLLYTTMGNLLFYNPVLLLQNCESKGVTQDFFGVLLKATEEEETVKRIYDRKQISLGLSSLLRIPVADLPQSIAPMIPHIVVLNITLLDRINDQICTKLKKAEAKKDDEEGESSAGASLGAMGLGMTDYVSTIRNDDDDEEGLEELARQIQEYDGEGGLFGYDDDSDDDYDPDDDSDDEGDDTTLSPFDQIDELAFFMEHLYAMQREPQIYQQLVGGMPDEMKTRLGRFEEEVVKRQKVKAEKEAAQGGN